MSAYIVEEKCLNNIINFLSNERAHRNFTNGECTELLEKLGYCLGYDDNCERLLRDMLWLNLLAVNGGLIQDRHDKGNDGSCYPDYERYPKDYSFKPNTDTALFPAIKSIRKWLEQLEKGLPKERITLERCALYVTFLKIIHILKSSSMGITIIRK